MKARLEKSLRYWAALADNPFLRTVRDKERRLSPGRRFLQAYGAYLTLLLAPVTLTIISCNRLGPNSLEALVVVAALLAFLQILYVAVRAAGATAPCVVTERERGTLMTLALTRLDSADYADGVVSAAVYPILRELLLLFPIPATIGLLAGASLYALGLLWIISSLVAVVFAYQGVAISASSRSASQAGSRALIQTLVLILGTPFFFVLGGFMAYPLWIIHPYAALALAIWGCDTPGSGCEQLLVLRWYALLFVPCYLFLIREVRARAIAALERVQLT